MILNCKYPKVKLLFKIKKLKYFSIYNYTYENESSNYKIKLFDFTLCKNHHKEYTVFLRFLQSFWDMGWHISKCMKYCNIKNQVNLANPYVKLTAGISGILYVPSKPPKNYYWIKILFTPSGGLAWFFVFLSTIVYHPFQRLVMVCKKLVMVFLKVLKLNIKYTCFWSTWDKPKLFIC